MRILTASLGTETNTFSPIATGWSAFQELGIYHYGEPLEVVHSIGAFAAPAGRTVRAVYSMRDEILRDATEKGPFNVALLSMHGVMVADGYDDCEGDLLTRLREPCSLNLFTLTEGYRVLQFFQPVKVTCVVHDNY